MEFKVIRIEALTVEKESNLNSPRDNPKDNVVMETTKFVWLEPVEASIYYHRDYSNGKPLKRSNSTIVVQAKDVGNPAIGMRLQ